MAATKRKYYLDLCRIIACLMVISTHIPDICLSADLSPTADFVRSSYIYFCRATISIFYMITGTLYLGREDAPPQKAVKKALRMLGLFLLWSALYIVREQISFRTYHSFNEFYCALFRGHYHLWFLTAFSSAYLFLPLVHSALHGKKLPLRYILTLFLAMEIVKYNAEMIVPERWRGALTMFSGDTAPVLVYMVYGYFLSKRNFTGKQVALLALLEAIAIPASVYATNHYAALFPNLPGGTMLPQSLMNFITASFVFVSAKYFTEKKNAAFPFIQKLSAVSMGVYLIHPFFIDEIRRLEVIGRIPALFTESWQVFRYPYILAVITLVSFAASFVVSKIPVLKKIITV